MTDVDVPGGHDPIDDLIGSLDLEPDPDIDAVIYDLTDLPGSGPGLQHEAG